MNICGLEVESTKEGAMFGRATGVKDMFLKWKAAGGRRAKFGRRTIIYSLK